VSRVADGSLTTRAYGRACPRRDSNAHQRRPQRRPLPLGYEGGAAGGGFEPPTSRFRAGCAAGLHQPAGTGGGDDLAGWCRGAATGTRTRDLDDGNVALYLLSYSRTHQDACLSSTVELSSTGFRPSPSQTDRETKKPPYPERVGGGGAVERTSRAAYPNPADVHRYRRGDRRGARQPRDTASAGARRSRAATSCRAPVPIDVVRCCRYRRPGPPTRQLNNLGEPVVTRPCG
jgi:hypothetical protein